MLDKFILKEEHCKLLKNLNIASEDGKLIVNNQELLGSPDVYEDIHLILNGNVEVERDELFKPIYKAEDIIKWNKLLSELPIALNVILYTQSFEPGEYVKRSYNQHWFKK